MDAVQLAPTGQSTQVIFVFSCKVTFLLWKLNDVFKDSFSRIYVPHAHGIERNVPTFTICFKLDFVQLINNDEII